MYKRATLFLIGIGILAFVLYMVDFFEVVKIISEFPLNYFLLLLIIELLIILISSIKWKIILHETNVSLKNIISTSMVGYFVNNITPVGIAGGEPVKAYLLCKVDKKVSIEKSFASVIVDLFLEIFPIFILAIISFLLIITEKIPIEIAFVLGLLTLILLSLFVVSISLVVEKSFSIKLILAFVKILSSIKILKNKIESAEHQIHGICEKFNIAIKKNITDPYVLIYGTLASMIKWILVIAKVYIIFLALKIKISFTHVLIVQTTVIVLSGLPLLPGALGIWEGASVLLFTKIAEISAAKAAAVTLIDRILFYLLPSIIGLIFAIHFGINVLKEEEIIDKNKLNKIEAEVIH